VQGNRNNGRTGSVRKDRRWLAERLADATLTWDGCTIAGPNQQSYRTRKIIHQDGLASGKADGMTTEDKTTAGRAFVRSLNILLKFARLYGYEHARTSEQLYTTWGDLRTAITASGEAGLLLGATGTQLLLDGVPLEGTPAEKQFAQLLSAAGLASIQFLPCITEEELANFARAFPTGKVKPSEVASQLKAAISDAKGIHVNEICFVATDVRLREAGVAAQIAASLGASQDSFTKMLRDPRKLLELIAAAEGTTSGGSGTGHREGSGTGPGIARTASIDTSGEAIFAILRALTALGKVGMGQNPAGAAVEFQDHVSQMPGPTQDLLRNALATLAEQGKDKKLDQGMLVQLAEHLAIKFALERFERGEVKVNAVRHLLQSMNGEIEELRKVLGVREAAMTEAGLAFESRKDALDRQFWEGVPERSKREVLLSPAAWCIPPKNVQSYVASLIEQGEKATAIRILQNYVRCTESEELDARKRTASGISELAGLYAQADPRLLVEALRYVGLRLSLEQDQEVQSLANLAFAHLSQQAAAIRCFTAIEQALHLLVGVEAQRPGIGKTLRANMGIEERIPEFVEEALRSRKVIAGLTGVLKQMPQAAMEQLAVRFNRCQFRDDLEQAANLAQDLGEEALQYLRSMVHSGPHAEAVEMVGLLVRLDPRAAEVFLPSRMKTFPRLAQDRMVRQIASSAAPGRCRILLAILDHVDPLIMPLVVDEIGMTEDREALGRLLTLAEGDLPAGSSAYLRVKAIEGLGRLKAPESASVIKRILEARKIFGWEHPQELRIAALQALEKLKPAWVADFLPKSGIEQEDLRLAPLEVPHNSKFLRYRRHTRIRLQKAVATVSTNLKENCHLDIKTASLSGGLASTNMHLAPGTQVQLRMQLGLRNLQATALMRDYRAQDMSFEIVDMGLEERAKFRKLLLESLNQGSVNSGGRGA
jgi:hypothetical protein